MGKACRWLIGAAFLAAVVVWTVHAQAPPAAPGKTPPGTPPSDVELVERVLGARKDYQVSLEQLRAHYISVGDVERAQWAQEELKQYHRILKQAYRLELDVP